jgi:hypothetical protein
MLQTADTRTKGAAPSGKEAGVLKLLSDGADWPLHRIYEGVGAVDHFKQWETRQALIALEKNHLIKRAPGHGDVYRLASVETDEAAAGAPEPSVTGGEQSGADVEEGDGEEEGDAKDDSGEGERSGAAPVRTSARRGSIPAFIVELMRAEGKPVAKTEIVRRAIKAGVSSSPASIELVVNRLARQDRLERVGRGVYVSREAPAETIAPAPAPAAPHAENAGPAGTVPAGGQSPGGTDEDKDGTLSDFLLDMLKKAGTAMSLDVLAYTAVDAGLSKSKASVGQAMSVLFKQEKVERPRRGFYAALGVKAEATSEMTTADKAAGKLRKTKKAQTAKAGAKKAKAIAKPRKARAVRKAEPPKPKSFFIRRAETLEQCSDRLSARVARLEAGRKKLRARRRDVLRAIDAKLEATERELDAVRAAASEAAGLSRVSRRFDKLF